MLMMSKLKFTGSCPKLKMAISAPIWCVNHSLQFLAEPFVIISQMQSWLRKMGRSDGFIGNICNFSVFPRTEMVWDDAMQEPTAADHGDVLYNIGINLCVQISDQIMTMDTKVKTWQKGQSWNNAENDWTRVKIAQSTSQSLLVLVNAILLECSDHLALRRY